MPQRIPKAPADAPRLRPTPAFGPHPTQASPRFVPSKHSHAAGSLDSVLARHAAAAARPSLSQPEMTRALQRAASRTLEQSTDPEQQAPALLRAMREVLDAPNAVAAEEEEEPTSPSSLPMQQFSLDVNQPLVSPNGQALIDAMYEALHGVEGAGAATEASGENVKRRLYTPSPKM